MHSLEHIFHNKEQLYRTIASQHPFPTLKEIDNYKKMKRCIETAARPCCTPPDLTEACEKTYYTLVKNLSEEEILQIKHICQCNKLKFIFNLTNPPKGEKDYQAYEIK